MSERHRAAAGRDQRGDVLWRVPGRFDQMDRWTEREPFRWTSVPDIALVDRPEVVKAGPGKKRRVERVVRVMVGKDDIADLIRGINDLPERTEDGSRYGDHSRVDDDPNIAVPDEADRAGDAIPDIASKQDA